jgi:3-hydroxyisobutyrate dehydrogenase-like beta-hydroxyacid dehydrogenase
VDDDTIRAVVSRLARPHSSGGKVIERAAILASGSDSSEVLAWIAEHGAVAEDAPVSAGRGGLFGGRLDDSTASRRAPGRYVLPPDALG